MSKLPKPTRFEPSLIDNGSLKIPRAALRFAAEVEFADEQQEGDGPKTIPVSILARSNNPLQHWFFGKCIHDMAGMTPASEQLPIDYCHDDREVLGFSDDQEFTDAGLLMNGVLIPFESKDRVDEVMTKHAAGFRWQSSIYFDSDELLMEFVPEDYTAEVNGQEFEGPGVIFREWMLRGVAICPYGYDPNTSVQFSKSGDDVAVQFQELTVMATKQKSKLAAAVKPNRHDRRKAAALAAKPNAKAKGKLAAARPATKPAKPSKLAAEEEELEAEEEELEAEEEELEAEEGGEEECECAGEEGCECEEEEEEEPVEEMESDDEGKQAKGKQSAKRPAAKLSPAQKEVQMFVSAFGAQGGVWFSEGLTFDEAQTRFNQSIRDENAKLKKKVGKLSTQLAEMRGEDEPLSATPAEENSGKGKTKQINGLTPGAAKFAASMKIRR